MDPVNGVILAVIAYALALFGVAFIADRSRSHGLLRSPLVYTLSISVYCTSWTFYGAVGSAARGGLEFATIYLGPTLVFLGAWTVLRKMLRIGRENNITSIADFISSRYGKSDALAAVVTIIAVAAVTPYIALQLKAVSTSLHVIGAAYGADFSGEPAGDPHYATAFWVALGLAVFTILFGTRNIDASERHYGVVAAIAVEALVKLAALIAVGLLAVFSIGEGPLDSFARIAAATPAPEDGFGARWMTLIVLSASAILCLPRQFQVTVVENNDERHLHTASWLFPLYLFLMCLFIVPIAAMGSAMLPEGSNPDMFVLTMPIALERDDVAMLAFLGGFSSATSMVIVSCIAVSTMISNHIVVPWALRGKLDSGEGRLDLRSLLLNSRRISIALVLMLGFLYMRVGATGGALASIGLIAFAGVAQVMPALLAALYWPRANRRGALLGLIAGFGLWLFTLVIPELASSAAWWRPIAEEGLFGLALLRPAALLGVEGLDPLVHAVLFSLGANALLLVAGSLSRDPRPIERLQSALFVDVFRAPREGGRRFMRRAASARDLLDLASRVMGLSPASRIFVEHARKQGLSGALPEPDDAFIDLLERRMASSVGAASSRAMISRVSRGEHISLDELLRIADETARLMEYSAEVERKSAELEQTALQLRAANDRLRELDAQKDDFLSQVSHEVRTPMTSIRSFAEILTTTPDLSDAEARRFLGVIHDESLRLTRLLDEILDMSLVERGRGDWRISAVQADEALERAIDACRGLASEKGVRIRHAPGAPGVVVEVDEDRLRQVFINVISNAIKYNDAARPEVRIASGLREGRFEAVIEDNGPGVSGRDAALIFEKFSRGAGADAQQGAGLGLAISSAIMARFDGELSLLPGAGKGARFRIALKAIAPSG